MAKTRQRAREERERLVALAAAERRRETTRAAARRQRRARLTRWLPQRSRRPVGALATKRAVRVRMTLAVLVVADLLVYLTTRDLRTLALALVVSVLVAPVVFTLLHRRR